MFEQEHRPQQQISRRLRSATRSRSRLRRAGPRPSAYAGSGERFARLAHLLPKRRDRHRNVR